MNFNSLSYVVFLAAITATAYLLRPKLRNGFLLLVSYGFYLLWEPRFALLLLAVTILSYILARAMERKPVKKRLFLVLGLLFNLGLLLGFKYLGFFTRSVSTLLQAAGLAPLTLPSILLPVGISFFTFVVCGYLIDVYHGAATAERRFLDFALFVSFFPSILSGPIERAGHLLPQIRSDRPYDPENIKSGLLRFLTGLFKKLVLADQLAVLVNTAYGAPETFTGLQLLFAALCYSMQIYCDFAAYSDMAIGSARLLGFRLLENFDAPYRSRSIKEFWRRWHMSLSFWFRDYLYFPLGGSRKGRLRTYVNILIVFTVSGLWHGAAWTFVFWGLLNGVYQVAGSVTLPARRALRAKLHLQEDSRLIILWQTLCTFLLLTVTWVFFRAATLSQALLVLRRIFTMAGAILPAGLNAPVISRRMLFCAVLAIFIQVPADCFGSRLRLAERLNETIWLRWTAYAVLVLAVLIFGAYGTGYDPQEFVYFKF